MITDFTPRPCPICLSSAKRTVMHRQKFFAGPLGDGYEVVVCELCGAAFATGIPNQAQLDVYYEERSKYTYSHADGAESPFDFKRFETIADQIESHLPSKAARILDIGCATGGLLAVLKRRGYLNVYGSDPSSTCATAARRIHGIDVRTATLAQHASWRDRFDAVLMVGVLEHVRDVRSAVAIAGQLLEPTGFIYCAQPDVVAFEACQNAPYQQFSFEHINFFSQQSLTRMMAHLGFVPEANWRWLLEWREGMTDSAVSGVYKRGHGEIQFDHTSREALHRYLIGCAAAESVLLAKIDDLVKSKKRVMVWGAGTLTRRLLATSQLTSADITAFIDSNPAFIGQTLVGRPIISPEALSDRPEPILICSQVFEAEIRSYIALKLKLKNQLLSLCVA